MFVMKVNPPNQQRLITILAGQYHESIGKVTQLYEQECSKLMKTARITNFLHILVTRHVRDILNEQMLKHAGTDVGLPASSLESSDA